ncbi:hypothetical protein B0H14DRAFT_2355350, partial [Mycena olivaceomarginata]
IYHISFPNDPRSVKCLVYFLLLGITVSICLIASDVQAWYGYSFGDIISLVTSKYTSFYIPIMSAVYAMIVHMFFCYRIFVIRRAVWPLCVLIALVCNPPLIRQRIDLITPISNPDHNSPTRRRHGVWYSLLLSRCIP